MAGLAKRIQRSSIVSVDLSQLDYKDLQAMAKEKGLRSVGISKVALIASLGG